MTSGAYLDLSSLARELAAEKRHPTLVRKIRQIESVASAHEDLRVAKETLQELALVTNAQTSSEFNDAKAGIIGGALFSHAIILYTRATETKPIDRMKWFGRHKLAKELRPWHEEVMSFRNTVLTHFGHGEGHNDGPTVTHALVMHRPAVESGEIAMSYLQNRANTRAVLSTKLVGLTDACLALALSAFHTRLAELLPELRSAAKADQGIGAKAQAHGFDPSAFTQYPNFDLKTVTSGSHHWTKPVMR